MSRKIPEIGADGDGLSHRILLGVIRQTGDGTGWEFLDAAGSGDTLHKAVGFNVEAINQTNQYLDLVYNFEGSIIGSLLVVPDETMAKMGIRAGGSVDKDHAYIYFSADMQALIEFNGTTLTKYAPAFIKDSISVTKDANNRVIVTHPQVHDANDIPVVSRARGGWNGTGLAAAASSPQEVVFGYDQNSITLEQHADVDGIISYSGGTWNLTTNSAASITRTWNAGKLEVRHPYIDLGLAPQVTSLTGGLIAQIENPTNLGFDVKFYDYAGTQVTTPATTMKFTFRQNGRFRTSDFGRGYVSVRRGGCMLDPNKVYSPTGNFWIFGVMPV